MFVLGDVSIPYKLLPLAGLYLLADAIVRCKITPDDSGEMQPTKRPARVQPC